jgi:hypothetical protein
MSKTFRRGWYGEPYRHYLARKGVSTGRGYFAVVNDGRGNRTTGVERSLLAQPKRDAQGNVMIDPMSGKPMYPTKAELGLPYAPKKAQAKFQWGAPETDRALGMAREDAMAQYGSASPDVLSVEPAGSFLGSLPSEEEKEFEPEVVSAEEMAGMGSDMVPGQGLGESLIVKGGAEEGGASGFELLPQDENVVPTSEPMPSLYAAKKVFR